MDQTDLWRDITTSVQRALQARLDRRDPASLMRYSDALLATLPGVSGLPPTTAGLLRRYHTPLHQELCRGTQPRAMAAPIADELRDLTRAVLVTIGTTEGVSIEAAVGLALVLYTRGVAPFCALPILRTA
jgi:hypothetical protein